MLAFVAGAMKPRRSGQPGLFLLVILGMPVGVPSFLVPSLSGWHTSREGRGVGCRSLLCGLSWLDQQVGPSGGKGRGKGIKNILGSKSLGLDWGHKKIGVATSAGFTERPLGTIPNTGGLSDNVTLHLPTLDHILMIAKGEGARRVVVGNPLYRDGTLSPQAKTTLIFSRMLANRAVQLGLACAPELEEDDSNVEDATRKLEGAEEGQVEQQEGMATGVSGLGERGGPAKDERTGEGGPGAGESEEPMKRRKKVRPFVYLWDERLTSQAAKISIRMQTTFYKSADVDSQAACLILEDFYRARGVGAGVVLPDPVAPGASRPDAPTDPILSDGPAIGLGQEAAASGEEAEGRGGGAAQATVSYRDWIAAERQRYASDAPASSEDGNGRGGRQSKKKKRST